MTTAITPLTYDEVMRKLPQLVAECLALDLEDVTPEMPFCREGDSIEILDLNFRCQKAFGVKSPFQLFLGSRDLIQLDKDGFVTETSRKIIGENYPFFAEKLNDLDPSQWNANDLLNRLTVDMIAQFVLHAEQA